MKAVNQNDKVIFKNDRCNEVLIKAKSIYNQILNLGHYTCPAGNCTTQTIKLKEKALNLTDNIIVFTVSR